MGRLYSECGFVGRYFTKGDIYKENVSILRVNGAGGHMLCYNNFRNSRCLAVLTLLGFFRRYYRTVRDSEAINKYGVKGFLDVHNLAVIPYMGPSNARVTLRNDSTTFGCGPLIRGIYASACG